MPTFEELKDKALEVAGVTAEVAKQLALISKCRILIVAEQEKIRNLYTKLGKTYYKDFVTDEEPDEAEYNPLCDSISEHYRKISHLRDVMDAAKKEYQDLTKSSKKSPKPQPEATTIIPVTPIQTEGDILDELEELNNLNKPTSYGEILD